MEKHTPGQWIVQDVHGGYLEIVSDQGKGWNNPTICTLYEDVTPNDSVTIGAWYEAQKNAVANARLISAAPDLLDALETLVDMVKSFPSELHKEHPDVFAALEAIAKATATTS